MIFIAVLFAPTVPSDPSPQNMHLIVPSGSPVTLASYSSDLFVTSSFIPIVKSSLGSVLSKFLYTASIIPGVTSLDPRPYLPPIT